MDSTAQQLDRDQFLQLSQSLSKQGDLQRHFRDYLKVRVPREKATNDAIGEHESYDTSLWTELDKLSKLWKEESKALKRRREMAIMTFVVFCRSGILFQTIKEREETCKMYFPATLAKSTHTSFAVI
jgi:hypothetical protein